MATITTDTYLDGGTARTAGETWSIGTSTLTIRTDTRWHANAPASMTGSLGSLTIGATGGGVTMDGTKVRWMPFDTGTGNVPAIGTAVTQGGVSGYLLGVWADYVSAPAAVGAAMPASGFIKFREVTSGPFIAGALTGIGANATSPDVTGWIEVVMDQSAVIQINPIGSGLVTNGDWFYLSNTSGSAGQQFQIPANGGGATTWAQGMQIETAVGSGVYEWFPAIPTNQWLVASFNTDMRSKFCQALAGGILRIGSDGTNAIGYTPPAGCKVRIPNIIQRQCTTAARAANVLAGTSSTRPKLNITSGGTISLNYVMSDWYFYCQSPTTTVLTNSIFDNAIVVWTALSPFTITNICIGQPSTSSISATALAITNCKLGGTITNCKLPALNSGYVGLTINYSKNITISNAIVVCSGGKSVAQTCLYASSSNNINFTNLKLINAVTSLTYLTNSSFLNTDYIDRCSGATTSAGQTQPFLLTSCTNVLMDVLTFGFNGTYINCNPMNAIIKTVNCFGGIKLRNVGTYAAPLDCSYNVSYTLCPGYVHRSTGPEADIKLQRIYLTQFTNLNSVGDNTCTDLVYEHIYGGYTRSSSMGGSNTLFKGVSSSSTGSGGTLMIGSNFTDTFQSATTGSLNFNFSPPGESIYVSYYFSNTSKSGFSGTGYVLLRTAGDYIIAESPYFIKGHTSFRNSAAVSIVSSDDSNYTFQYQLDKGSGWDGTWKLATAANLLADNTGISATTGFKIKIKITAVGSVATANIMGLQFLTNSTATDQATDMYALDTATLAFTGLAPGSEVRCYTGTDPATAVEIGGIESTAGSTFSFTHSAGGVAGYITILAMGYQPVRFNYTFKSTDDSILIQPVVDRNYVNPP